MKARRKLIPAIVLLLVSVLMLSTASYAWFANRTTVEVSGLSISAQAPSQIKIKLLDEANSGFHEGTNFKFGTGEGNDVKLTNVVTKKLSPTHVVVAEGGVLSWTVAASTEVNDAQKDKDGLSIGDITPVSYAKLGENDIEGIIYGVGSKDKDQKDIATPYYIKLTYHLYAEIDNDIEQQTLSLTGVKLTDSTSENDFSELYKSVRVLVVAYDDKAGTSYKTSSIIGTDVEYTSIQDNVREFAGKVKLFDKVAKNASDKAANELDYDTVELYIFFDGKTDECKTELLDDLLALDVSCTFGIETYVKTPADPVD